MALGRQGLAQFASKFSSTAYKSASERVTLTPVAAAAVAVCSGAPFQPAWQCLAHAQPSTAQVFPAGQHAAFVAPSYTFAASAAAQAAEAVYEPPEASGFTRDPLQQPELKNEPPPDKRQRKPFMPLDFNDFQEAAVSKKSWELVRSWGVFTVCQIQPLVKHADSVLSLSKRIVGSTLVNFGVKHTFFAHFCAGEDGDNIQPKLQMLHSNGIGGILDYAAEDDVGAEEGPASRSQPHDSVIARTFDYGSEADCDAHMRIFMKSIEAAANAPGQGFAAIKVTALGNPKLLERVSSGLVAIRNLFSQFDSDMNNVITREEFKAVYEQLFSDATEERIEKLFDYLDCDHSGYVDYLSWSRAVKLEDIPNIIKHCRAPGPLYLSSLSEQELKLLSNMMQRLHNVAETAAKKNVRLMVDAEHSYFQPAIDHAVVELQRKFNHEVPVILNTYQCYLRDSGDRLMLDIERSRREHWRFGAKLVRGAYMYLEKARADELGYPSPVWDSLEQTHANYNRCIDELVTISKGEGAEVMIATHNQRSIERAVALMNELDVEANQIGVYFGQLLGMADHLTFILGRNGYRAYKYVPFGPVEEVMPYLIRRAQENSDIMTGVTREKAMIRAELWRRMKRILTFGMGGQVTPAKSATVSE